MLRRRARARAALQSGGQRAEATGRSRRHDQRGAVIVEAAVVFPLLFLIVFGAIEYGLLFRDDLTGSNVVRAGGRVLSAQANLATADQSGVQALLPAAAGFDGGLGKLSRVVVYFATCANPAAFTSSTVSRCGANPPIKSLAEMGGAGATCADKLSTTGVAGRCNVYTAPQLTDAFANNGANWGCTASSSDRYWCPSTRIISQTQGTDYVGIQIEYSHKWVTGLFGSQRQLTDSVIFRVEPQGA